MTLEQQLQASLDALAPASSSSERAGQAEGGRITPGSPLFLMPPPAPPGSEIPATLSPSSTNAFIDCQARWYYRKVLKLPETRGSALALGTSVHAALIQNYRQKIETHEDLFPAGARAIFIGALKDEMTSGEVELQPGEDWDDLKELGKALVTMYMERAAPVVQPAAVEEHVTGVIGGVPVQGYIDVRDVDGRVIDIKTAARKPTGITPAHKLQLATYAMLHPQASGLAQLTTLTKTKTVAMYQDTAQIGPRDKHLAESMYSIARDQMQAGIYSPNRSSHLCSRKFCSYASRCCDEFGGEVL